MHPLPRVDAARTWARASAHSLNNLLTLILGNADFLVERSTSNSAVAGFGNEILEATNHLHTALRELAARLGHSPARRTPQPWDSALSAALAGQAVEWVRQDAPAGIVVGVDTTLFDGLVTALVSNANEAHPAPPRLSTYLARSNGSAHVAFEVENCAAADFEWPGPIAFEPFYTTKPHHPGLGLTYSLGVAVGHGGALTVGSPSAGIVRATLLLPHE